MSPVVKGAQILIVEDDQSLNQQITGLLTEQGYQVTQCFDGEAGLVEAVSQPFDLVLLDVMLPERDGFSVLNNLRKTRQTPVMMLTACGAEEERIAGFSKGADDYLAKPFNLTELLLRIEALLRRSLGVRDNRADVRQLTLGELFLDRHVQSLSVNSQPVELTSIQFKLLWMLVSHQHEVLSKPYLHQLVLEREFSCYDRSLDMHLSRVRRKLTAAGLAADRFQTVRGKGYVFV